MSLTTQEVAVLPFGTYSGKVPFYYMDQTNPSGTFKTEIDLIVTLSMVDNSDSDVIKITFNTITPDLEQTSEVLAVYKKVDCHYTVNFTGLYVQFGLFSNVDGIIEFKNDKSLKLRLYGTSQESSVGPIYSVASSSTLKGINICNQV